MSRTAPTANVSRRLRAAARQAEELAWLLGDTHTDWVRVCHQAAIDLGSQERFDAVWTTSAPFGHSYVGLHLHHLGVPWVADLRDPASRDVVAPNRYVDLAVRARRHPFRSAFRHADAVVAATEQVRIVDHAWLGREPELILSGFDSDEWATARAASARSSAASPSLETLEIVFAGKIYENYRRPDTFLRGLRTVIQSRPHANIRFSYYGRDGALLTKLAAEAGATGAVVDHGFKAPAEMPEVLASAGALLLLTNEAGATGVPGGKFFEMLAAHRPILAVPAADLFAGRVLSETGAGVMAANEAEVVAVLDGWLDELSESGTVAFHGDPARIEDYSSHASAAQLARVLDRVAKTRETSG